MSTEQNKAIARRYLHDVWHKGNPKVLGELVSSDIRDHNPSPGQPCGYEGQAWAVRMFHTGTSNVKITIEDLLAEGDKGAARWTCRAAHTGDFFGMPATGKSFSIAGMDMYRFADGKIVEVWHVEDQLGMAQQLGLAPAHSQLPESFGRPPSARIPGEHDGSSSLSDAGKKALVRRVFEQIIDRGNLETADSFLTPDFAGHFAGFPPVYGSDGFKQFQSIYTNALSDRHAEVEEILVDGDRAACRVTFHGTHRGSLMGMPPTGLQVAVPSLNIFRFAGDRIAEVWGNSDGLRMLRQLGMVPETAKEAEPVPC